jgi:A/G-specific adenine glycosylase
MPPSLGCDPEDDGAHTRREQGIEVRPGEVVRVVEHTCSHLRAWYHAMRCEYLGGEPRALGWDGWAWAAPDELDGYALPVAQRKIAALVLEPTLFTP